VDNKLTDKLKTDLEIVIIKIHLINGKIIYIK